MTTPSPQPAPQRVEPAGASTLAIRPVRRDELLELAGIDSHSPGGGWSEESFANELALAWSRTEVAVLSTPRALSLPESPSDSRGPAARPSDGSALVARPSDGSALVARPSGGSALAEGRLAGFIVYWAVADEVQLLNIAVHPDCRRAGVGGALIGHLIARARDRNAARVLLEVRRSNRPARELYERAGFVVSGVRAGYYERGAEDAILMECPLQVQ